MKFVQPIRSKEKIDEIKRNLKRKNYRNYFLFTLGINTGFRISDILDLKVIDVKNKSHVTIKEKKTGKTKKILINHELRAEIEKYVSGKKMDDYLFPSRNGGHIKRIMAYRILNGAAAEVGLSEIGTHTLRKTFGYHFYKRTKKLETLKLLYNHSSDSDTLRYLGITQDVMDEAFENFSL